MSGSCAKFPVPTGISITVSVPSSDTTVSLINSAPDSSTMTSHVMMFPSNANEPNEAAPSFDHIDSTNCLAN